MNLGEDGTQLGQIALALITLGGLVLKELSDRRSRKDAAKELASNLANTEASAEIDRAKRAAELEAKVLLLANNLAIAEAQAELERVKRSSELEAKVEERTRALEDKLDNNTHLTIKAADASAEAAYVANNFTQRLERMQQRFDQVRDQQAAQQGVLNERQGAMNERQGMQIERQGVQIERIDTTTTESKELLVELTAPGTPGALPASVA
jgi:hypothetical protein